jgi:hypothetical protein
LTRWALEIPTFAPSRRDVADLCLPRIDRSLTPTLSAAVKMRISMSMLTATPLAPH